MSMLVPVSDSWRGTVGEAFATGAAFRDYVASLQIPPLWPAQGVCLHNTAEPNLQMWRNTTASPDPLVDGRQRLLNLAAYYKGLGWNGGPHLFVTDTLIWVFNPLTVRGTHSRCFNSTHFGIEMVGDFAVEPFNPRIRDLAVEAMAVLYTARGLDPRQLAFHKDCAIDNHDCPGGHVGKADMIRLVLAAMGDQHSHVVTDDPGKLSVPPEKNPRAWCDPAVKSPIVERYQTLLIDMGFDPGPVDGWLGKKTEAAGEALSAAVKGVL